MPGTDTPQALTLSPNVPPPVETVVNRFKLWRTGSTLPVCFLNGGQDLRELFVSTARTWLNRGGLRMDFGAASSYRTCQGPNDRAIRVAFGYQMNGGAWDTGNWSYVGIDANTAPAGPTINIGYAANATLSQLDPRELRRLIWHEVGHALALEHEHQSPLGQCEFDWTKVVPYYSQYGWDEKKTRFNLERLKPVPGLTYSAFDPASIMNYSFPAWMFVQTAGQNCEIRESYEPSPTDLLNYAVLYPGRQPAQAPISAVAPPPASPQEQEQQAREVQEAQQQQDRAVAERAVRAMAALQLLLPDEGQRRQAAELIARNGQQQFGELRIDQQGNKVSVGSITQSTAGPCSSAIAGVGGSLALNNNCTTTNNTIGTQSNTTVQGGQTINNVAGGQLINNGTLNNQGGMSFGPQTR